MSDARCPICCGELSYCGEPADDGIPTIDCVYCKQRREIEQLRAENHHLRGLLETAVDAWECGQAMTDVDHRGVLLTNFRRACLPKAWWDEARKAGGDDGKT